VADEPRRSPRLALLPEEVLADLGRAEAIVAEVLRAGGAPVVARGLVPLPELAAVRVGVFGEAGTAARPAWEGWLPSALAEELSQRDALVVAATWDAGPVEGWSVCWTETGEGVVVWTSEGARLRVDAATVDVLEAGRWTVLPIARVARLSLGSGPGEVGLLRLHTVDGRSVGLRAGRVTTAPLVTARVAAVLGVDWAPGRWDG